MPDDDLNKIDVAKVVAELTELFEEAFSEEAAVAAAAQKRAVGKARAKLGWEKNSAQRNQRIAAMHRPKSTISDGIRVFINGRPISLSCWVEQPQAVHAIRRFDAFLNEISRLIAAGEITPDEVSFLCSEFFFFTRDRHNWFVLKPGQPPIKSNAWSADHAAKTITFKSDGKSLTIAPPRFSVIAWYLAV